MDPEVVDPANEAAVPQQTVTARQQRPVQARKLTPPIFLLLAALTVASIFLIQNFCTFTLPSTSLTKDLPEVKTTSSSPSQTPILQKNSTQDNTMSSTEQT